ncbi:MAG: hypothetical protein KDI50_04695 [Candidatus Competibacteraceae bacterium]|nr:hypothetical protein [Candidatus Competibacteraceae bacterium]
MQHPGAVPAGSNPFDALALGGSLTRSARATLRGGQRIDAGNRPAGRSERG